METKEKKFRQVALCLHTRLSDLIEKAEDSISTWDRCQERGKIVVLRRRGRTSEVLELDNNIEELRRSVAYAKEAIV